LRLRAIALALRDLRLRAIALAFRDLKLDVLQPASWKSQTAIILGHGAGQGMSSPFMTYFHRELANRGFLSVTFDFEYMEAKRRVPDPQPKLQAWYRSVVDEIAAQYRPARIVIGGKSMGGRVASYIAGNMSQVSALLFLGYPLHPPGKPDQLRDQHLYKLGMPMLFISGTKDTFAERALLERTVHKIGENAELVWIEDGDHSLKRKKGDVESLAIALDAIVAWAGRIPEQG
jgi:predicted alpha/beta-hydrolase family hydrolase